MSMFCNLQVVVCSVPCLCACSRCALTVMCVCVVFDLHCAVVKALCMLCVCEQTCTVWFEAVCVCVWGGGGGGRRGLLYADTIDGNCRPAV